MSEQKAEQISGEPGSLSAGVAVPPSSDAQTEPLAASVAESIQESPNVVSPDLVPEQAAGAETPKIDAPKADAPKTDAKKADVPRAPGKVMIMSTGDRRWARDDSAGPEPETEQSAGMFGKRRFVDEPVGGFTRAAISAVLPSALRPATAERRTFRQSSRHGRGLAVPGAGRERR